MKTAVRRISVVSVLKISFFLYWALGLCMALLYGGMLLVFTAILPDSMSSEFSGMSRLVGGIGAIAVVFLGFFFSILYAAVAALFSAAAAALYNVLAGIIGGLEVEIDAPAAAPAAPSAAPPPPPPITPDDRFPPA